MYRPLIILICLLLAVTLLALPVSAQQTRVSCTKSLSIEEGQSVPLVRVAIPSSASTQFTYASSNERVAAVDSDGLVTGLSPGTARITVSANGASAVCEVTVVRAPVPPMDEVAPPRYTQTGSLLTPARPTGDEGRAVIMLTGDLMALSAQQNVARIGDSFDFRGSFSVVRDIFATADFVVGNLETLTSQSSPYTCEQKTINDMPHCNAPATYLEALRYAGFDGVAAANNHSADGGAVGIVETVEQLAEYGIACTGIFKNAQAPRYFMADVNGIRVAFLSYAEGYNGKEGWVTNSDVMLNKFSLEKAYADIAGARTAGAEFVIVYIHWGAEGETSPGGAQFKRAQQLADAGADMIAGSHPHVLQEAGYVTAQDGRQVPCVYSMGNFVSSMASTDNNDTVIVRLELIRDSGVKVASFGYIPCRVVHLDDAKYVVMPTDPGLNGGYQSSALTSAYERITARMGEDIELITLL